MVVNEFEGKNLEETIANGLEKLNITETDAIIKSEEIKSGLLKKISYNIKIYKYEDIEKYIKEFLINITKLMGLEINVESKRREEQLQFKMYSDNNSILIGKDGRTLSSLTYIIKQMLINKYDLNLHIILDVENYKEKQEKRLEIMAKKIAREVAKTKMEVKLDNMNSYERRIIHNALSKDKYVTTISEGEEPNRHIIIKLK